MRVPFRCCTIGRDVIVRGQNVFVRTVQVRRLVRHKGLGEQIGQPDVGLVAAPQPGRAVILSGDILGGVTRLGRLRPNRRRRQPPLTRGLRPLR
ncbi:MAG: hypothetical protein ABW215_04685 [Kibdelosporangium sp.]